MSRNSRRCIFFSITALFAALIAGGTFVTFPLPFSPVPVVLQNLFAVLSGLALGPGGTAAAALYLAAGALGAPVFAGASGGIARFAGPTGGFLAGYLLAALTAGLIAGTPRAERPASRFRLAAASAAGFLVIYGPGLLWLHRYTGSWPGTAAAGLLPFLPGDAIKAVLAVGVAGRFRRVLAGLLDNGPPDSGAPPSGGAADDPNGA
jgi:biotin transport system substrate-specific component